MNIALLLSGLHYRESPKDNINYKNYTIDFRYYIQNIKHYLFCLGEIDTYIVTNDSPIISDIHTYYNPIEVCIMEDTLNRRIAKTWCGIKMIEKSDNKYDYICITRFDIYFMKKLELNYEKINVFSQLEISGSIDDNFYFLPISLFSYFISVFETIKDTDNSCSAHHLSFNNIHYICNEKDLVHKLSSFKLRFFKSSFSLNNIYTKGIIYHYSNYWICINNHIQLHKNVGNYKAGFSVLLNTGEYIIKHNYSSNVVITKYILLNETLYGNNSVIMITKPTTIYFVFDMYDELNIIFYSISFVLKSNQLFKIK
jgi:hypothetical protein